MKNYKKKFKANDILNYLGKPVRVIEARYSTEYSAPVYDIESIKLDHNGNSIKLENVHEIFLKL